MTSFSSTLQHPPRHWLGIGAITGAVLLLSFSDALVKLNNDTIALGQLLFSRSLIAVSLLVAGGMLTRRLARARKTPNVPMIVTPNPWIWFRSACLSLMWACYYASLPFISLSLAAACYYTAPVWMAVLSTILQHRHMIWKEKLAVLMGLCGVLLVLRPGLQNASLATVLPLFAAFLYALAAIMTSSRLQKEPPISLAVNLNLVLMLTGLVFMAALVLLGVDQESNFIFSVWSDLNSGSMMLLVALGFLLATITTAVAFAYQSAPATIIGLFDNCYLIFAFLWSIVLFEDTPDLIDLLGIVLVGSGAALASASLADSGLD